jgi:hypothetical protein
VKKGFEQDFILAVFFGKVCDPQLAPDSALAGRHHRPRLGYLLGNVHRSIFLPAATCPQKGDEQDVDFCVALRNLYIGSSERFLLQCRFVYDRRDTHVGEEHRPFRGDAVMDLLRSPKDAAAL